MLVMFSIHAECVIDDTSRYYFIKALKMITPHAFTKKSSVMETAACLLPLKY